MELKNRKYYSYAFLAFIVIAMIIGFNYEEHQILLQLIMVSLWFVFELVNLIDVQKQLDSSLVIKVKSNEWLHTIFTSIILVYFFTNQQLNLMNQIAIGLLVATTLLKVITVYRKSYKINNEGIFDLVSGSKLINPNSITELRINDLEISIDTKKYQNDFQVKKSELRTPNWNKLKEVFSDFNRTWASPPSLH